MALPAPAGSPDPRVAHAPAAGAARMHAAPAPARTPHRALMAIIVDDLGERNAAGLRTVNLPGPVACAFLPDGRFTVSQARLAHARGKEVLLHLPLEPGGGARAHPVRITPEDSQEQLVAYLDSALEAVPHVRGVNNHQGSLLTERAAPMGWLMSALKDRGGLYFVDSRTSQRSVAYREARARRLPSAERHLFLDHEREEPVIRAQFRRLVARALRDGRALGIGHPYPETLRVLEEELPRLAALGVRLVAPSELIRAQGGDHEMYAGYKLSTTLSPLTR